MNQRQRLAPGRVWDKGQNLHACASLISNTFTRRTLALTESNVFLKNGGHFVGAPA